MIIPLMDTCIMLYVFLCYLIFMFSILMIIVRLFSYMSSHRSEEYSIYHKLGDEPTGALDKGTTQEIMSVFQTLHEQEHTIVIVAHDPEIADSCDSQMQLEDGRI